MPLLEPGHLEQDYPITTVFGKEKILKLRGQVSSNGFYIFTFTILQAFPLCKAYMLRFGQVLNVSAHRPHS